MIDRVFVLVSAETASVSAASDEGGIRHPDICRSFIFD
jgi:hypothetical protein